MTWNCYFWKQLDLYWIFVYLAFWIMFYSTNHPFCSRNWVAPITTCLNSILLFVLWNPIPFILFVQHHSLYCIGYIYLPHMNVCNNILLYQPWTFNLCRQQDYSVRSISYYLSNTKLKDETETWYKSSICCQQKLTGDKWWLMLAIFAFSLMILVVRVEIIWTAALSAQDSNNSASSGTLSVTANQVNPPRYM